MKLQIFILTIITTYSFGGIKNLELNKAIKMLKTNNQEVKIANFENLAQNYETRSAIGNHFGKLDMELSAISSDSPLNAFAFKLQDRTISQDDFKPDSLNNPDKREHYKLRLSYNLPIYTGGKIEGYRNVSNSMLEISKLNKKNILNKKIFEVKTTFYNISLINEYIKSLSKILTNTNKIKKTITSMRREGYAKKIDLLEIKSRISKINNMHSQGISEREMAYSFLSFLVNKQIDTIKPLTGTADKIQFSNDDILKNSINIQLAKENLEIQESMHSIETSNFLPQIGFFANLDMEKENIEDVLDAKESSTMGIMVKVNIFNGGVDIFKNQKSKIKILQSMENVKFAQNRTFLKIKKLQSAIKKSKNNIESLKDRLKLAQAIYKNYKAKYREGLVSIDDMLIKQSKEIQVTIKLLEANSKYNTSMLELNYITNKGE